MNVLNKIRVNLVNYSIGGSGGSVDVSTEDSIEKAYINPSFQAMKRIDENGNVIAGGSGTAENQNVSDMLPVVSGEVLTLSGALTVHVAYYDGTGAFISPRVTVSSGINDYIVPANAKYARFANAYTGGDVTPLFVRRKQQPKIESFYDVVKTPIKSRVTIGFTGDSNTYGYGISSPSLSWAGRFITALDDWSEMYYGTSSKWVECIAAFGSLAGVHRILEFNEGSEFSIWTDATSVTLERYSEPTTSSWKWLVDGTETGTASSTTLTLDGGLHKVTVQFTGGRMRQPYFKIGKTILCENAAHTGDHFFDVEIPYDYEETADTEKQSGKTYYKRSGEAPNYRYSVYNSAWVSGETYYERVGTKDWMVIMIGTNDRGAVISGGNETPWIPGEFATYSGKGTYIIPFPNHAEKSEYVRSQMETYTDIAERFKACGYDIINNISDNAYPFLTSELYQQDGTHFNENGHAVMANIISGKLGLPLYLNVVS